MIGGTCVVRAVGTAIVTLVGRLTSRVVTPTLAGVVTAPVPP